MLFTPGLLPHPTFLAQNISSVFERRGSRGASGDCCLVTSWSMGVGRLCREGGMGKVGASSVFDSTTITEFVNQNSLFSSLLLTSDVARTFC